MNAIILKLDAITTLTPAQFHELCRTNRDLRLELTAQGELDSLSLWAQQS